MNAYEEDILIDPENIDEEWLKQPALYSHYGEMEADARKVRDDIAEELKVAKALIEKDALSNPKAYGLEKPTVSAVAAAVVLDPSVQNKERDLREAEHAHQLAKVATESMQQKKYALQKLSDLFIFDYNSEPKAGRMDAIRELKKRRRAQRRVERQEETGNED